MDWYKKDIKEVNKELGSNLEGLSIDERGIRLSTYGENVLTTKKEKSELAKFLAQFQDLLIYVLIASAILKAFLGAYLDMIVIMLVVIINSLIGYIQEKKAISSVNSLKELLSENSTILIDNIKEEVPSSSLVIGDIVKLSPGSIIPADIRLIESHNFSVDEAILTGESEPILKDEAVIAKEVILADRINMVYSGTLANTGTAMGVVVATGDNTELGKISANLNEVDSTETPLLKKMKKLNKQIFYTIAALMLVLFFIGTFFRHFTTTEIIIALIALAVASVPEGMPAVLSLILSVGVSKMASKNAIIKKMPAVETLGSMNVICSDKTGTLTKNEMAVLTIVTKDEVIEIDKSQNIDKLFSLKDKKLSIVKSIENALYCNETIVKYEEETRKVIGNPTEAALLDLVNKTDIIKEGEMVNKIPFDSSYKYMAVLVELREEKYIFIKGAPDIILNMTKEQLEKGLNTPIDLNFWEDIISKYGSKGQRMLAAAYKKVDINKNEISHEDLEEGLIFTGLFGIIDPPKPASIEAIKICHQAGIGVKMITGDHKDTALAIAEQIGLENSKEAIVGNELENMTDEELTSRVLGIDVYARTTPEHKLRIVKALQANKMIVGMTGDGVNDAPALKRADIGIAMGIKGTQVTKNTADMVLADDNFGTIAEAVKVGRHVYDNLKKTIYFLLPTAFAQGLLVVVSILLNKPLPLTSLQILWLNMVSTITLSFGLAFEPESEDIMNRKPRDADENILNLYSISRIIYVSILIALAGFTMNILLTNVNASEAVKQTALIQTIIFGQIFYMINCREITKFSLTKTIFKNKVLWISILVLLLLQYFVIYISVFHKIFGTTKLDFEYIAIGALLGLIIYIIVEIEKLIFGNSNKNR